MILLMNRKLLKDYFFLDKEYQFMTECRNYTYQTNELEFLI